MKTLTEKTPAPRLNGYEQTLMARLLNRLADAEAVMARDHLRTIEGIGTPDSYAYDFGALSAQLELIATETRELAIRMGVST